MLGGVLEQDGLTSSIANNTCISKRNLCACSCTICCRYSKLSTGAGSVDTAKF